MQRVIMLKENSFSFTEMAMSAETIITVQNIYANTILMW